MSKKARVAKIPDPISKSKEFKEFRDLIGSAKRVLLSTHLLPDGDGLGAEYALYHYLKRAKKACRVYNPDPLPKRYRFLDPKGLILLGPGEVELWDQCDLWVILDTNDPRRVGKLWPELSMRAKKIVFLDHHPPTHSDGQPLQFPPNAKVFSDVGAGSIGEQLYRCFEELGMAKPCYDISLGLYVSVMTDTNSFRYARTTPLSHRIAAQSIELGVNPEEVYQNIFSSKEISHLRLLGQLLQEVRSTEDGRLAWFEMPLALRRGHGASADDTQSFLNLLLLLRDSEVVCLFREEDDGQVRVSMKSKGRIIINRVAMEFGGGGHEFAAGLSITSTLPKTVESVTKRILALMTAANEKGI